MSAGLAAVVVGAAGLVTTFGSSAGGTTDVVGAVSSALFSMTIPRVAFFGAGFPETVGWTAS